MDCFALRIDWSAIGDVLGGLGALIAGIATIALAYFAGRGLNTWRHQLTGTRDIQLVEEILIGAYETEESFRYMTAMFSTGEEHEKVPKREGESDDEWKKRAAYGVAHVRYNDRIESFNKLRAVAFRAKAVMGQEAFRLISEILSLPRTHIILGDLAYRKEARLDQMYRQRAHGMPISDASIEAAETAAEKSQLQFWGLDEENSPQTQMSRLIASLEGELAARQAKRG